MRRLINVLVSNSSCIISFSNCYYKNHSIYISNQIATLLISVAVALPDLLDQDDDLSAKDGSVLPLAVQQGEENVASSRSLLNDGDITRIKLRRGGGYDVFRGYGRGYG